jgi:NAD+ diphosphatase
MNTAFENGFYFHHAHQSDAYVLMILWLDKKVACRVPAYAHHYIGVGGVVISETGHLLLIKENRSLDGRKWKLPGGYVDSVEKISDAVEREVKEETGVIAKFVGLLSLREQTNFKYEASDFYIGCVLFCDNSDKIDIEDVGEVKTAEWVSLDKITD